MSSVSCFSTQRSELSADRFPRPRGEEASGDELPCIRIPYLSTLQTHPRQDPPHSQRATIWQSVCPQSGGWSVSHLSSDTVAGPVH